MVVQAEAESRELEQASETRKPSTPATTQMVRELIEASARSKDIRAPQAFRCEGAVMTSAHHRSEQSVLAVPSDV